MATELVLWLRDPEHPSFVAGDRSGVGRVALATLLGRPAERADSGADPEHTQPVRLLLPAERVLACTVGVPALSRRQFARALPFAVEEKLAIDLDSVHIASGPLRPNEPAEVRIVEAAFLQDALAQLDTFGLRPTSVQVDADCLPLSADLALLVEADRVLLRDRSGRALACARASLPFVFAAACKSLRSGLNKAPAERAQSELNDPSAERSGERLGDRLGDRLAAKAYVVADAPLTAVEQALLEAELGDAHAAGALEIEPVLDPLRALNARAHIELLQGRFATRRSLQIDWRIWRPVGVAALVLLLLLPLLDAGRAWRLQRDVVRVEAETQAYYGALFPGEQAPEDLRRSFEARLAKNGGEGIGFSALLTALAAVNGSTAGFELQSVSYQRERDELAVQVLAGSLADLERYKAGFAARKLVADISSAEQEAERVRARLRIHAAGVALP